MPILLTEQEQFLPKDTAVLFFETLSRMPEIYPVFGVLSQAAQNMTRIKCSGENQNSAAIGCILSLKNQN